MWCVLLPCDSRSVLFSIIMHSLSPDGLSSSITSKPFLMSRTRNFVQQNKNMKSKSKNKQTKQNIKQSLYKWNIFSMSYMETLFVNIKTFFFIFFFCFLYSAQCEGLCMNTCLCLILSLVYVCRNGKKRRKKERMKFKHSNEMKLYCLLAISFASSFSSNFIWCCALNNMKIKICIKLPTNLFMNFFHRSHLSWHIQHLMILIWM